MYDLVFISLVQVGVLIDIRIIQLRIDWFKSDVLLKDITRGAKLLTIHVTNSISTLVMDNVI